MIRRALALLAALLATTRAAAPPTVPWQEASAHVGELVTVEGDVSAARTTGDVCVLEFAPDDPQGFRVVLLIPLVTSLPREPDRLYRGKRVQASGRVQRFQGRPEMVLRNPDQITVVDVSGVAAAQAATPSSPAPAPVASPDGVNTPALIAAPPPAPRPLATTVAEQVARFDPCPRARERWRDAAATLSERSEVLQRCLDALGYHCRDEATAIAPALATLEWAEQQVEEACR